MALHKFVGSQAGRGVRLVVGLALIVAGIGLGRGWVALAVVGGVPLAAGVFDVCLLGPLFRLPFAGSRFRQATSRQ